MRGFMNNIPHRLQILRHNIGVEFGQLTTLNKGIVDVLAKEPIGKKRDYCVDGRHVENS